MSHMNPGDLPTWFRKERPWLKCNPQVWQRSDFDPSTGAFLTLLSCYPWVLTVRVLSAITQKYFSEASELSWSVLYTFPADVTRTALSRASQGKTEVTCSLVSHLRREGRVGHATHFLLQLYEWL